ncbi:MAG: NAD(P)-dependent oxidoreductase [Alphaproteobacteria bacterium]
MTVTVAMHERSLADIGDRLKALALDVDVVSFGDDGNYRIGGAAVAPADVDVDYVWLSQRIGSPAARDQAFDTVLATRSVDVVQTFNAGLDHPFYRQAADRGIRICNSSAQSVAIAEYTMAQVLALFHPVDKQRRMQSEKEWAVTPFREISRTKWLIVGYGAIGGATGRRAKAFGAEIMAIRRNPTTGGEVDRAGRLEDLPGFLPEADVILLSCPLTDATRDLADAAFFAAAKPGAILVNVGRGGLIDDAALIAALDADKLECAVLDVFRTEPLPTDDPLWSHPKVRLTSHTSFAGSGVQHRWDQLFLDNIARYAKGEPLDRLVDPADI